MPRARASSKAGFVLVLFIVVAVFAISPLGTTIGITLIASALAYGAFAAWRQANIQRLWAHVKDLSTLSGVAFEQHVAETYRRLGYRVTLTKQRGRAGADVIADNGAEKLAIQCKQYSGSVGIDAVQQAYTGKAVYSCTKAVVICTSYFTPAAKSAAKATDVQLIDGKAYAEILQRIKPKPLPALTFIPRGSPLRTEIGWLAAGIGVLIIHSFGASLIMPTQTFVPSMRETPEVYTAPPAQPQLIFNTPVSQPTPTLTRGVITLATKQPAKYRTPPPKHPPWWTPPPTGAPSPVSILASTAPVPESTTTTAAGPQASEAAPEATPTPESPLPASTPSST